MPVIDSLLVVVIALLVSGVVIVLERWVPAAQRAPHNDVVGFVYAVVGVAYAVILAMVVVAAWGSLDEAKANTYTETDALVQLDWYGRSLPPTQHAQVHGLVKEYAETVIRTEWPMLAHHRASNQAWSVYAQLRDAVSTQQPTAPADSVRYRQALDATAQLGDARRRRVEQTTEGIPPLLWVALVLGGMVTVSFVFFFGMRSRRAHMVVVFSLTFLIGYLLLVVNQLEFPYSGAVKVEPHAFELALQRIQTAP